MWSAKPLKAKPFRDDRMTASPPIPQERVLPTLNQDGSRRRIRPKLYEGSLYKKRFVVGWGLMALFVSLPLIRIGGAPAVFLDLASREFTFFGRTFFATDGVLLMLLMLGIFVGIVALTALVGRGWCGWACPQTVYMEFLYRPIERLFEGDRNAQLKRDERGGGIRRVLKNLVFLVLSVFVANVFLAYFVSVEVLLKWMSSSPFTHPAGFLVMGVTALLVFFDFAYFREQMCTVACPYARLQAALLDKDSLIIGYQESRGEPRHKGKSREGDGDCVDCGACVVACPTGIDIREGLQLECIACGQCIDACNTIMPKVKKAPDLIRYASQNSLSGSKSRLLRPRVFVYGGLIAILIIALLVVGSGRNVADVTILRGIGAPFVLQTDGVRNQIRVKIENRLGEAAEFRLEILHDEQGQLVPLQTKGTQVITAENPLKVDAKGRRTTSVFLVNSPDAFVAGRLPIVVRVTQPDGVVQDLPYHLLGPS